MRLTDRVVKRTAPTAVALLALGACAAPPPLHERTDAAETLRLIAERNAQVRTLTAPCVLELERDGERVTLEGAVAARWPDHLRLRGWKLGRAVVDLTIRPDGIWTWAAEEEQAEALLQTRGEHTPPGDLRWSPLFGLLEPEGWNVIREEEARLHIQRSAGEGWTVQAEVDRPTLTVRRYTLLDPEGGVFHRLELEAYRGVGDLVWPTRITAHRNGARLTVRLRDVRLNETLSASAFEPPSRAVRRELK